MRVYRRTRHYWFEVVHNKKRYRRSTGQTDKDAAKTIAAKFLTNLAEKKVGLEKPKPVPTVGQLFDGLKRNYETREKASIQNLSLIKRARADFGENTIATDLSATKMERFVEGQKSKGFAAASINRKIEALKKAFKVAKLAPPDAPHLPEENVREGFFTREEFDRLLSFLPDQDLKDFCSFAYHTGMRLNEIRSLRWQDVADDMIRLRGEDAKTKKPRSLAIAGPLEPLIERRRGARAVKTSEGVRMSSTIFHRGGEPVGEFRKSWTSACIAAELGKMICPKCKSEGANRRCKRCKAMSIYVGKLFHDFRRTGVRNLIRAGVAQSVAMKISGHKTVSVFERYNIIDGEDLVNAMKKLEEFGRRAQA